MIAAGSLPFDLNEIAIFVRVVQTGSFIGASRQLGIPKSTISRRVAQLEGRLGARLLQRTTRKLNLTEVGRMYFQRCEGILMDVEEANQQVMHMQAQPTGTLRLSASLLFGSTVLKRWLVPFLQAHPHLKAEILLTNQYLDLVSEGIDLAFRAGPLEDSSLIHHPLGRIPYWVCASPTYLQERQSPQHPRDLLQHHCLVVHFSGAATEWLFQKGSTQERVAVEGRLGCNDFLFAHQMALESFGVAYLPSILIGEDVQAGRLVRLLPDWHLQERPMYWVYPSARHLSPKVTAFLDWIAAHPLTQIN
ncbi:MAG: LysR family transcriptional regulator [Thermostichus sp. BF3_bins_97]